MCRYPNKKKKNIIHSRCVFFCPLWKTVSLHDKSEILFAQIGKKYSIGGALMHISNHYRYLIILPISELQGKELDCIVVSFSLDKQ